MFQCKENLTICCFLAHKFPFTHLSSLIRINESSVQLDIQNRKWLSWKLSGLWFKEAVQISTRHFGKVKVKCTLVQTLRLCTGRTAHRGSRGIALPFHDHGTRRGWGVSVTPQPLFSPGKSRYLLYRRLGGPQGRSGKVRKISPPPGFDPRTVQPVASRYTDYTSHIA